ncbi:AhpC-TSA-domain-containing protein [Artomyces pyxidatus]|uniref:AhpC-TSA-domain-containing protein n=1 Tax=Artomyces pyxidatus TaxID=48021 RepID=A0ACB8SZJ0_9AGAM|nr:AhpC-TSA-domain-containing protein [Artomyces pyxidatus]
MVVYTDLIGKTAPTLTLPSSDGSTFTFTPGTQGAPVALFFYPKAGSYGCTKEVCQFRDALVDQDSFKKSNIHIIGISPDPVDELKTFAEKQKVTYPMLSDQAGEARRTYGVGKALFGMSEARVTFFIDEHGVVRDALDATINFGAHVKFVSKWLDTVEHEHTGKSEPAPTVEVKAEDPTPSA